MNLPIDTCETARVRSPFAANTTSASMPRTSVVVEGISRQRQCAWCINFADGCATTVLAHYHKAGANNLIGETFSTKETGVIEIWEV